MFGEGAKTYYPIDNDPNHGGGPIRRSPLVVAPNREPPTIVYRTPHPATPDAEPGGREHPARGYYFQPDGRLAPIPQPPPRFMLRGNIRGLGQAADEQVTAATATAQLQEMYRDLQIAAGSIVAAYSGKASLPCEIRSRHNAAVRAYQRLATSVFAEMERAGYTPTQQLFDQAGNATKQITVSPAIPVLPAIFTVTDCSGAMAGAGLGQAALAPAAAAAMRAAITKVGTVLIKWLVVGTTVYAGAEILEKLIVAWKRADRTTVQEYMDWLKVGVKLPPPGSAEEEKKGFSWLEVAGIAAVVIGVIVVIKTIRSYQYVPGRLPGIAPREGGGRRYLPRQVVDVEEADMDGALACGCGCCP